MTVKTRFAPSPTGFLHIGGARTALFSWLEARRQGGEFVLRIEDTDQERSTAESVQAILDGMQWLGLDWDEGPYYQTERFDRYREVIQRLLDEDKAYYCYCSRERLDELREGQRARGEKPRYDGRCRDLDGPPEGAEAVKPVVRFRNPQEGQVVVEDRVRGRVAFDNSELDDLIIARGDGTPTYNLTVVVDDADMGVTRVIRDDDHLNNTPRQINILKAMGVEPPEYAHVAMILGEDGKRLSKRHGAVSVLQYRDDGYLPEALLNYLVRLGWSHGDQEVFTRDEMLAHFSIDDVNRAASTFNPEKLLWLNQQYLKTLPPEEVSEHLLWHFGQLDINPAEGPPLGEVVLALRERSRTLLEMAESARMFYEEFEAYDEKAVRKNFKGRAQEVLERLHAELSGVTEWNAETLHAVVTGAAESMELKLGKVAQPLRVAVSGGAVSPPIDLTLTLLGRERTLARITRAIGQIPSESEAD